MNDSNDPFIKPDRNYFDHVFRGFCTVVIDYVFPFSCMVIYGFGCILGITRDVCCIMFGWPLYLLSKLTSEERR